MSVLNQGAVSILTGTQIHPNVWGIIFDVSAVLSNFCHCSVLKRFFFPHLLFFFLYQGVVPLPSPILEGTHL